MDAPNPSKLIEEMSVTFLPQFLGTVPCALSPLGALAGRSVSATFVEDSSTKIRRFGSTPPQTFSESTSIVFVSLGGRQRLFCMSTRACGLWPDSSRRAKP